MMMPANFTAVNSEVVYGGADLFSILADTTAPIWNAANVKTFNTNLLTILSNSFTKPLINATMGTMFSGTWGDDDATDKKVLFGDDGTVSALYKNNGNDMTFGNKVMKTIGLAASVYTLGTTPVKNYLSETVVGIKGDETAI